MQEKHSDEAAFRQRMMEYARFRRKTCCVSRSEIMVDLTVGLYSNFHVNRGIDYNDFLLGIVN